MGSTNTVLPLKEIEKSARLDKLGSLMGIQETLQRGSSREGLRLDDSARLLEATLDNCTTD